MNNPLGVSPSKGKQGTTRGKEKIFWPLLPRVVPCFPLLGLTPSGLFMGLSSTIIYTSELILWFHYIGEDPGDEVDAIFNGRCHHW